MGTCMNILVSNDDGILALGVRTLAATLAAAGHRVTVVCPDRERSATGHGLTMHKPLRADPVTDLYPPEIQAWACSGTPSDCVKLALGALLETPPDVVVSGINHGANLGTDVLYSGTVSAAMEGAMEGMPAIAVSLTNSKGGKFDLAAAFVRDLLSPDSHLPLLPGTLLNVNVPNLASAGLKGAKVTRQGIRRYHEQFAKRTDPRGKTYYWLAGEALEDIDEDPHLPYPPDLRDALMAIPTDVQAIQDGYISITPLQYNLTAIPELTALSQWMPPNIPIA